MAVGIFDFRFWILDCAPPRDSEIENPAPSHPGTDHGARRIRPASPLSQTKPETPANTAARAPMAWEWLIAGLLSANLAWTSLCLGGVRAETQVWSSALTAATLAALLARALSRADFRPHWAGWCVLPFLLYAAANVLLVTPVRWLGERDWWQWFQIFATLWIVLNGLHQRRPRQLVLASILLLGIAAVILAGYQLGGHRAWLMLGRAQAARYDGRASGFFGNPNTLAAFFVLLIPPVLAGAWRRGAGAATRAALACLALVFAGAAVATLSRGGLIALALALVCWPLAVREWRWRKRALVCASAILAAALACSALLSASPAMRQRARELAADHGEKSRLILWQASLKMTAGAPFRGTGAGSFNTTFEKFRPEGFRDEPQWTHNEYLNTLGDYGIIGLILLLGGVLAIVARPASPRAGFTRALGIGLLGLAFACVTDFHMKIPAIGMIAAVCLAEFVKRREALAPAAAATTARGAAPAPWRNRAFSCACAILLAFIFHRAITAQLAEAARVAGREKIDALALRETSGGVSQAETLQILAQAGALFEKSLTRDPANAQTWSDRAYALALQARAQQTAGAATAQYGRAAERAARAALDRSTAVPEFWLRLGVALDLQGLTAPAGKAFAQALALAPSSALAWYHQAYHLSLTPATRGLAQSALDTCLRLDPAYANAEYLRQQLARNP